MVFGDEVKGPWPKQVPWGAPQFQLCLVGGTFDRLHAGHRLLLNAAVRSANRVEIHVTSDAMADQKSVNMQSFETRRDELLNWVELHAPQRVSVHELTDRHGPAPSHSSADCIVATPETCLLYTSPSPRDRG